MLKANKYPNQFVLLRYFFVSLWLLLGFGSSYNLTKAQSDTDATSVNAPVIPEILIDSIDYDENRDVFRVNLSYVNQGRIGGLQVKIENADTEVSVKVVNYAVTNAFEIDGKELEQGTSYNLTITGLTTAGEVMRLNVPQSYGADQLQTITALGSFEYEEGPETYVGIARLEFDEELLQYSLGLDLMNVDDVTQYNIWLEGESGLIISEEMGFRTPLSFPLIIPLEDIPSGKHTIVIEAINEAGEVLTRSLSDDINYAAPRCGIICFLSNNSIALGVISVVVLVMVILLTYSFFRPKTQEFELQPNFAPSNNLVDERDISIYAKDTVQSLGNAPQMYLVLESGINQQAKINRVHIQKIPFSIGSAPAPRNHLCLNHPEVSGQHAIIRLKNDQYYVRDANSTNGTKINGEKVPAGQEQLLRNGTKIGFANVVYRVELS